MSWLDYPAHYRCQDNQVWDHPGRFQAAWSPAVPAVPAPSHATSQFAPCSSASIPNVQRSRRRTVSNVQQTSRLMHSCVSGPPVPTRKKWMLHDVSPVPAISYVKDFNCHIGTTKLVSACAHALGFQVARTSWTGPNRTVRIGNRTLFCRFSCQIHW